MLPLPAAFAFHSMGVISLLGKGDFLVLHLKAALC